MSETFRGFTLRCFRVVHLLALVLLGYGCSSDSVSATSVLEAGNVQAAQGQLVLAIASFQSVCQQAPTQSSCVTATLRLGQLRLQAAEQACTQGNFIDAQRFAFLALVSPEEPTRQRAQALLASDTLKQGIVAYYQRQSSAAHDDAAKAKNETEEKRLRPLRKEADTFVSVFAATAKKRIAFDQCLSRTGDNPTGELLTALCREEIYKDSAEDGYRTRYTKERTDEFQWRRILRELHDESLTHEYEQKKAKALADVKASGQRVGGQP